MPDPSYENFKFPGAGPYNRTKLSNVDPLKLAQAVGGASAFGGFGHMFQPGTPLYSNLNEVEQGIQGSFKNTFGNRRPSIAPANVGVQAFTPSPVSTAQRNVALPKSPYDTSPEKPIPQPQEKAVKAMPSASPVASPAAASPATPSAAPIPVDPYKEYLQRSMANPAASYEGHGGKVAVYRGRMPGSPGGNLSNTEYQGMRRQQLGEELAGYEKSKAIGLEAQAHMEMARNKSPETRFKLMAEHPEYQRIALQGRNINPAAVGGIVNPNEPISIANWRTALQPGIVQLLDAAGISSLPALAQSIPGGMDPNHPHGKAIAARLQEYLLSPENRKSFLTEFPQENPWDIGQMLNSRIMARRRAMEQLLKTHNVPFPEQF